MIKERENYLVYAFINIFGLSFNNVLNHLNTKKYIDEKIYEFKFLYYIKELRIYFMTTLIIALYTQLNQTFLGTISQRDLAYYIRSKTLLGVGTNVVNSLITVFIPRTAYLVENNYEEYKRIIQKSINYIYLFIGVTLFHGTYVFSKRGYFAFRWTRIFTSNVFITGYKHNNISNMYRSVAGSTNSLTT